MEELGIGRPSTYASIIQVLQDRTYVVKDRGKFIPEDRGRLVVSFLNNFFARYVNMTSRQSSRGSLTKYPTESWTGRSCWSVSGAISRRR